MRYQRFVILIFIATGILAGISVNAGARSAFAQFSVADQTLLGVLPLSGVISIAVAVATFAVLVRSKAAVPFTHEVVEQLVRVTWPEKQETIRGAVTVVATAIFTALLIGAYDFVWRNAAAFVLAADTVKNTTT